MIAPRFRVIIWFSSVLVCGSALNLIFQNCSQNFSVTPELPTMAIDHPSIQNAPQSAKFRLRIGDQEYLKSVFMDVFTSDKSTTAELNFVNAVFQQELSVAQHLLGRSCSVFEQGSTTDCYYTEANQTNQFYAGSSAGREGARYQVCRRLISNNSILARVIDKLPERTSSPDEASTEAALSLFFPDLMNRTELVSEILASDLVAARAGETVRDRWKLIFLILCESPVWQMLAD